MPATGITLFRYSRPRQTYRITEYPKLSVLPIRKWKIVTAFIPFPGPHCRGIVRRVAPSGPAEGKETISLPAGVASENRFGQAQVQDQSLLPAAVLLDDRDLEADFQFQALGQAELHTR